MSTRLSPDALQARLRFDFNVVSGLRAPWLRVLGFASVADLRGGRQAIAPGAPGAAPALLLVHYGFPTLAGPGRRLPAATVEFDLLAGGNYPFTSPHVIVLPPLPWVPRVHPTAGIVCTGSAWGEARGQVLLAHLVVQVARLLNLDEPHTGTDFGFQAEATDYWQTRLGGRPLNPGLQYPALPVDLTHGVSAPRPRLRPLARALQGAYGRKLQPAEFSDAALPPGVAFAKLPGRLPEKIVCWKP